MVTEVPAEVDAGRPGAEVAPMREAVIVGGARTAFGRLLGSLRDFKAVQLGGFAIKAALERSGVPADQVDYVIMGQVLQAGAGQIPSRQAPVAPGIPMTLPSIPLTHPFPPRLPATPLP